MNKMVETGYELNIYTYNALINGFYKENMFLKVDNIFGKILGKWLALL